MATPGQVLVDLEEEKLDRRLLALAREAESAMQEQGCNILYASFGLLDWLDPNERSGKPSAAPLVLVPVELVRKDVTHRYRLQAVDDEAIVKPTLIELCKSNHRLELPALDHESAAPLDDFFAALEALLAGPMFKEWSVRREVHVGLFSFAKLLMYLHSRQASKRAILDELKRALEFEYAGKLPQDGDADELYRLRGRLNEYVRRLHERVVPLGISRFDAMGECAKLRTAPEAPFTVHDIAAWDSHRLANALERIESFALVASRVGEPSLHPWRGVGLSEIPLVVRQQLPDVLNGLASAVDQTKRSGEEFASCLGSPTPPVPARRPAADRRNQCDSPCADAGRGKRIANPCRGAAGLASTHAVRSADFFASG